MCEGVHHSSPLPPTISLFLNTAQDPATHPLPSHTPHTLTPNPTPPNSPRRTDEDMFIAIEAARKTPRMVADAFECTVGQKPSRAPFYLNDPGEVQLLMARLVGVNLGHLS